MEGPLLRAGKVDKTFHKAEIYNLKSEIASVGHAESWSSVTTAAAIKSKVATECAFPVVTRHAVTTPCSRKVLLWRWRADLFGLLETGGHLMTVCTVQPLPGSMLGMTEGVSENA